MAVINGGVVMASAPAGTKPLATYRLPLLQAIAVILVGGLTFLIARLSAYLEVFWLFGLAFGVILQKSRLCFASAFRDLFLLRNGGNMRGIILGMALATLGFAVIEYRAVPTPQAGALPPLAHLMPVGPQLVVGGLLFGVGMVVAGGCVSGSLYRMGEGYVGSWVAMLGVLLGLLGATHTWNWWWTHTSMDAPIIWLPGELGYAGAVVLTLGLLGVCYLLTYWWELRAGPRPNFNFTAPEIPPTSLRDVLQRGYDKVVRQGWLFLVGALALGVLNILIYQFEHPLGVTGELSNWANRAAALLGIQAPTLVGTDMLSGCLLVFETRAGVLTSGLMLDGGLVLGSFLAAALSGEFAVRVPRKPVRYVQSLGGGLLMGYGAGIAAGCTIGQFFSGIPSLGLNGFAFGVALLVGAAAGVQIIRRIN